MLLYCYILTYITGNYSVKTQNDILSALKFLEGRPLYAEKWAHFKMASTNVSIQDHNHILTLALRNWR